MSSKSTMAVGVIVAVLIVGALASIGYYQFEVAPSQNQSSSSTSTQSSTVTCGKSNCAYVNITLGAASCTDPTHPCGFSPPTITVVIGVNNTVVWTNQDSATHTVTPTTGSAWGVSQDCQGILGLCQGNTYQNTFSTAGTYQYKCLYHNGMLGEVIVKNS